MNKIALRADALLLIAAVIWGTGFVAQRLGMRHVEPLTFTAARFALGAIVLLPIILCVRRRPPVLNASQHLIWAAGAGAVLFVAALLQQIGIVHTTAGKAGFITGLYVVFVPLLGLAVGQRTSSATWAGAILAALGLYLLSVQSGFRIERGDAFVLACAVVWAVHVLIIGAVSPRADALKLAGLQFAIVAVLAGIAAALFEDVDLSRVRQAGGAILYSGVLSVGVAFTLQVVAQRDAPPAHAAILLSLEAVCAALAGWLVLHEHMALREIIGCAVMLTGMLVSQTRRARRA